MSASQLICLKLECVLILLLPPVSDPGQVTYLPRQRPSLSSRLPYHCDVITVTACILSPGYMHIALRVNPALNSLQALDTQQMIQ